MIDVSCIQILCNTFCMYRWRNYLLTLVVLVALSVLMYYPGRSTISLIPRPHAHTLSLGTRLVIYQYHPLMFGLPSVMMIVTLPSSTVRLHHSVSHCWYGPGKILQADTHPLSCKAETTSHSRALEPRPADHSERKHIACRSPSSSLEIIHM